MSKNSSRSSGGGSGGGSNGVPIFAAIMLGIVMGLVIAGGIAWMIVKKAPVSLAPREGREAPKTAPEPARPAAEPEKQLAPAAKPATKPATEGAGEGKARFEFYRELPDKTDNGKPRKTDKPASTVVKQAPVQHSTPPASAVTTAKPADSAAAKATYFLQAGAFTSADDAEKVKAKLALIGMEANVQTANIPDKGVWYRVRLGPYHGAEEMNAASNTLKQNGINAAPIRAQ